MLELRMDSWDCTQYFSYQPWSNGCAWIQRPPNHNPWFINNGHLASSKPDPDITHIPYKIDMLSAQAKPNQTTHSLWWSTPEGVTWESGPKHNPIWDVQHAIPTRAVVIRIITHVQQRRIFGEASAEIMKKAPQSGDHFRGVNRIIAPQDYSNDFFFFFFGGTSVFGTRTWRELRIIFADL